jgi:hypothetical protein
MGVGESLSLSATLISIRERFQSVPLPQWEQARQLWG